MSISDYEDEEVEAIHDKIEELLQEEGSRRVNTIIMGDLKSVVGAGREEKVVG